MNVLSRSYDNARSGANCSEATLTADAVKKRGIAKLFSLQLPGDARGMEAQPLVLQGVDMPDGSKRDVVYCATMANQVWAYDLNDGTLLWERTLGRPIQGSRKIDAYQINDHWGIISTPVIDQATGVLYAVAWISPDGTPGKGQHFVAALDVRDGSLKRPLLNVEGATYDPGHGLPVLQFKSAARKQRPALVLTGAGAAGTVFVAFGSLTESAASSRGWVLAVDRASFSVSAAWAATARGSGAGIWQAGAGPAADAYGNLYVMTGNGDWDAVTDWGESFLRLAYTPPTSRAGGRIEVADWWTPWTDAARVGHAKAAEKDTDENSPTQPSNRRVTAGAVERMGDALHAPDAADAMAAMSEWGDMDLGSGGPVLAPDIGMVLGAGKDGILYPVNAAAMGKTLPADKPAANYAKLASEAMFWTYYPGDALSPFPNDPASLNVLYGGRTHHQHGSFVVWKSPDHGLMAFCMGENGPLRAWTLDGPKSQDSKIAYLAESDEAASWGVTRPPGGMPGAMLCLSANGDVPGTAILWAVVPFGDANSSLTRGRLIAYDATRFERRPDGSLKIPVLWDSWYWQHVFTHAKFNTPVVCNGRVLVPTYDGEVLVYGLTPEM